MDPRRTLIVYRDELLDPSETFIRGQGESLDRFRAFYVGLRQIPGLALPDLRFHIVSGSGVTGKLQRMRFRLLGPDAALRQKLAANRPELVHAHFGPDACNAIPIARVLNVPLVVTFHGFDATESDNFLPRSYVKRRNRLKRHGARFLCVSNFIRERVIAQGFPPEKTIVHYTGIDTDFFCPHPGVSRLPIVLFVGRLVPKKGCEYLIRAISRVQEVMPEVKLVVIGEGRLRHDLEQQAAATLTNFQFLGAQDPTVVKNWMNRAMVFCTPSLTAASGDAEGFGMVFAEAQAMGLPVVSFASGGIPEVVADEQTGFLVPERDCESLAAKLLLLLSDRDLRLRFSEAGQSRVRTLFDIWRQTSALENVYESVLVERSRMPIEARAESQNRKSADPSRAAAVSID